jgi:hypothetical protein
MITTLKLKMECDLFLLILSLIIFFDRLEIEMESADFSYKFYLEEWIRAKEL